MIVYENECVGCPPEMGCLGACCPNRNVPHYYCDACGEETEHLYEWDGEELCDICYEKDVLKRISDDLDLVGDYE